MHFLLLFCCSYNDKIQLVLFAKLIRVLDLAFMEINSHKPVNVVCAVIIQDDRILAVKRSLDMDLAGFWEFPGGKMEQGELPQDALIRELFEELEVKVSVGQKLSPVVFDYGDKLIRLIPFLARVQSGVLRLIEHEKAVWLGENELFEVNWAPADVPIVKELERRWNEFFTSQKGF